MASQLVSVIMPVYNAEEYLAAAIDSVVNQSYQSWELICVDDCSSDSSFRLLKFYSGKDERIRVIRLSTNMGVAFARNKGLSVASGRYVAFLDSDDIWSCEKLERQIDFMRKERIAFSFTSYCLIDEAGSYLHRTIRAPREVTYESMLTGNRIGCSTVMLHIEKLGKIVMPEVRHEDYATWLQILKRGYVGRGLAQVLTAYRVSSGSLSRNKLKSALWTWNIYRNVEKLPFQKAILSFLAYCIHGVRRYYLT